MKKTMLFIAVLSACSFASCKKDRTCTCVTTYTGGGSSTDITVYTKSKKSAARAKCLSYTDASGTTTCTLK